MRINLKKDLKDGTQGKVDKGPERALGSTISRKEMVLQRTCSGTCDIVVDEEPVRSRNLRSRNLYHVCLRGGSKRSSLALPLNPSRPVP